MVLQKKEININSQKQLFKFLFLFFWRTKVGIVIALVAPLIFMCLYFAISNFNNDAQTFSENLAFYISLAIIPLSLITLPQVMVELKNSILLRKLKISGYSKQNIVISFFVLYFSLTLFFLLIMFLIFIIFLSTKNEFKTIMSSFNWANIIFSSFIIICVSILFGIIIGSLLKNLLLVQVVGILIFLLTMSLAGMFIPLELISNVKFIKIISLFSPLNYPINLLINSVKYTDDGTYRALQSIIDNQQQNPEAYLSLVQVFKKLNLDINNKNILDIIKKGNNVFDAKHSFYFFFQLGSIGEMLGFAPTDGTKIFDSWQKYLNLIMPWIFMSSFTFISLKYFSWFGR